MTENYCSKLNGYKQKCCDVMIIPMSYAWQFNVGETLDQTSKI